MGTSWLILFLSLLSMLMVAEPDRQAQNGNAHAMLTMPVHHRRALAAGTAINTDITPLASLQNRTYTYSAICAVGRNENRYIREWAKYHLCLGIGTIHLFDHDSTTGMDAELADLIAEGKVTYTRFDGNFTVPPLSNETKSDRKRLARFSKTAQGHAYSECLRLYSSQHTFIGFIDIDEFVVINDPQVHNIDTVLQDYEYHGGIGFFWRVVTSSGHVDRPEQPVVASYTSCLPAGDWHAENLNVKSFVNTRFSPVMKSAHLAIFPNGLSYVVDANTRRIDGWRRHPTIKSAARVNVYHYVTKSRQDFLEKVQRGGGAGNTRSMDFFDSINSESTETCNGAIAMRSRLCVSKGCEC